MNDFPDGPTGRTDGSPMMTGDSPWACTSLLIKLKFAIAMSSDKRMHSSFFIKFPFLEFDLRVLETV